MQKKELLKLFKKQKSAKKNLEKECHELWREIVYARANYRCEFPGCNKNISLNPHHIYSKGRFRHMRYDIDNGICLCSWHHTLGNEAAHKDINFKEKITGKRGGLVVRTEQFLQLLERKAMTTQKLDLNLELIYLKQQYDKIKNARLS